MAETETYYITKKNWENFLSKKTNDYSIFGPILIEGNLHYEKVSQLNIENIIYDKARPIEPLKIFFFPFKEKILPAIEQFPNLVIIGAANCDLKGLEILDKVFIEGDYKDPNYSKRRENTIVISIDCQNPYSTCFCEPIGTRSYPEKNFDINLTALKDGFILQLGSEKGKKFIEDLKNFSDVSSELIQERKEIREKTEKIVKENNKFNFFNKIEKIKGLYEKEYWKKIKDIANCVQCGSCTSNCPSCVCLLLEDIGDKDYFKKIKVWDSCLYPGYARMASGASPRPSLYERYANRFLCKYWYMFENFGTKGCTGCGRCISGCIGKIDKRKVLEELLK